MELSGPKETIRRARVLRSSMSLPERILWRQLRKNQTGMRFRRQHPAGPYVLDFYCDAAKLCVEIDGAGHAFTASRDANRDNWLARRGVRTLRIAASEVLTNLEGVVRHIVAVGADCTFSPSDALCAPPPPEGEDETGADPQLYP